MQFHPTLGGPENWIPLPDPITPENDPTNMGAGGMHEGIPNFVQLLKAQGVYCAQLILKTFSTFVREFSTF